MAIQKITNGVLGADAVASDNVSDNLELSGTSHMKVPVGTTEQRPESPVAGYLRFNTTIDKLEQYDGADWAAIDAPPTITAVSPSTELGSDDPQSIVITGSNFSSVVTAKVIGNNLTEYTPTTVTRNSSSQVTITFASGDVLTGANEPYDVKVTNSSGLSSILEDAFNINDVPTWSTTAGSLGTVYEDSAMSTVTLSASDPESVGITYSVVSGALPTGVSLNSSSGAITGTPNVNDSYNSSGVTHNFTVGASDGAQTINRSFSILRKWYDGSTSALAATSATSIKSITGTSTSGLYWLKPASWTYPAQFYCEMNLHGGGWIYVMQRSCVADNGMPGSWLDSASGTPNHATSNFYGTTDTNSAARTPMDIWDGFIGSSSNGKVYAREIFTSGGTYDESQRYVDSSDNAMFPRAAFRSMFYGNFSGGWVGGGSGPTLSGVRVYYNNGSNYTDNQYLCTWSDSNGLMTINNGAVDGPQYFDNGGDGGDANWSFGLGKGSTPFPGSSSFSAPGGVSRNSTTRWGIMAIKA